MAIGIHKNYTDEMKSDIDFILETIVDDVIDNKEQIDGSFTYLDAGGEQQIFSVINSSASYISQIMLDFTNITQNGTIKIYSKVDDINYREIDNFAFTVLTDSDGVLLDLKIPLLHDFKITYTEGVDETTDRIIPYTYILED